MNESNSSAVEPEPSRAEQHHSEGILVIPIGTALISSFIVWWLYKKYSAQCRSFLAETKNRTQITKVVGLYFLPLIIIGFFVEASNFSDVVQGTITTGSLLAMSLLVPSAVVYIAVESLFHSLDDHCQDIRQSFQAQLQQEEELRYEARQHRDFLKYLIKAFRTPIVKRQTALNGLTERDEVDLPSLLKAMAPTNQIAWLVATIYETFQTAAHSLGQDDGLQLRVVLFRFEPAHQCLKKMYAWNGTVDNCVSDEVEANFQQRFSIARSQTECLAVWVAVRGDIKVVEDAEAADQDQSHPFHFFNSNQRRRIGSLLVLPLKSTPTETPVEFVLCVDAKRKNFFRDVDKVRYESLAESLAQRVHHEAALNRLLQKMQTPKGNTDDYHADT